MKTKKKAKQQSRIRAQQQNQSFAQQLADKLNAFRPGSATLESFSDGSGTWVEYRTPDGYSLSISFSPDGETIDRIGLYKDVVEVVDSKLIWGN